MFSCLNFYRHESFDVNSPNHFTRKWFSWANTVFGDFILHLDKEYPHLLQGYEPTKSSSPRG